MIETRIETDLSAADEARWDAFYGSCLHPAYQQSRQWAQAMARAGRHKYLFASFERNGELIATAVIRRSTLIGRYWLASAQRGPLLRTASDLEPVIASLSKGLKRRNAVTLQFAPRACNRDLPALSAACRRVGTTPLAADRQPIHVATGIIDLSGTEQEIMAGFGQSARRKIRKAEKAGISVREVRGDKDIAHFQQTLDAFAAAHPDYSMDNQPDACEQAKLIGALGGAILLAECDGRVLAGASYLRNGDEAIWLSLANTGERPDLPTNYLLLWEKMRHARAAGLSVFDMAGIPLEEETASEAERKRLQFKAAFRPERRVLMPLQLLPLARLSHAILFPLRQHARALVR
ncbi:lipid II:glycine glycyltransferase FemX [Novosphingobium aquimarinum]|uniref:lipid II:glycine glycyltransferase FemX n=1 Tax=Novosphingobium aquimarinum TaxID=2682494 RepID=UPI0018DCA8F2|nr:peptidoglycan bridge formation glycyltransferase FemA/FemB family protein [Novosphingobium aquimarinum]